MKLGITPLMILVRRHLELKRMYTMNASPNLQPVGAADTPENDLIEQETRHALTHASAIVESIRQPLVVLNGELRIKSANRAFFRLFKVEPAEVIHKKIYELGTGQWNIERLKRLLEDILPHQSNFEDYEVDYDSPSIGRKTFLLSGRQLTGSEKLPLILLVIQDVTDSRLVLERDAAIKSRDELIGTVSHELRNPIAAIELNLALVTRSLSAGTDLEKAKARLATVQASLVRMNKIISDLLDVSRLEAGKMLLGKTRVKVKELAGEVLELVSPFAAEKSIELKSAVTPEDLAVFCDHNRIFQVLLNLLNNAFKFTGEHGQVSLSIECTSGGSVRFQVRDSGKGISADALPHIFERFWHSDASPFKGSGLGLYISRGIIESHDGRIWAESNDGDGTVISFELPSHGIEPCKVEMAGRETTH